MHDLSLKIALIGTAGIAAQWLAWRLRLPSIVLLLIAGFVAGPITGFINPAQDFGDVYQPLVGLAVAIILFEGGLTLNFREIRETSTAVRRIILISGPLVWIMSVLAGHYIAGLSWPTAAVLGAILIVTGPTVIAPLLRQARLSSRAASLLRWESIVNDPIGALAAVVTFEVFLILHGGHEASHLAMMAPLALILSVGGGWLAARFLQWAFIRGYVAEFLKAPILLVAVLLAYAVTNLILEEAGLLTVTIMGVAIANTRIASLVEIRRFKETITVLLVSGVFILLTASLTMDDIASLDWRVFAFVAALLFVIRPIAIFIATIGTGLSWQERLLTGWIAPRGIVAVAVSGLFGSALGSMGVEDGSRMVAVTFAVVILSIILHGFSLSPLAGLLGLKSRGVPGLLIVGGSTWARKLAALLKDLEIPVLIADRNWNRLKEARFANIPVYFGEILSEDAHHTVQFHDYSALMAISDNDAYNTLVCTNFGPELGRSNVFQIAPDNGGAKRNAVTFTLGGRPLSDPPLTHHDLSMKELEGWDFRVTKLTEDFTIEDYRKSRSDENIVLLWIRSNGRLVFATTASAEPAANDRVLSYGPKPRGDTPN
ncbi:sodium:proton antiporter [Hoeflea sp. WL0058]|uniref:Sodium:proton antiporter n=1 Tax=Flavimaribacter sediminis TaxID=2865987 RepID=A0AAE2ZK53_9HYPH|nr:sodium:proton antiporter [Flavimaribacter sediminis]MBW8635788.1 sodium:proton antiporter [Flavimaribacter sediminis]